VHRRVCPRICAPACGHVCPHAHTCAPGVVKPDRYKPVPDEPPNPTNVEETLRQIQADDGALEDVNLNNIKVKDPVATSPRCPRVSWGVPGGWSLSWGSSWAFVPILEWLQGTLGSWSSSRGIHVPLAMSPIPSVPPTSPA